ERGHAGPGHDRLRGGAGDAGRRVHAGLAESSGGERRPELGRTGPVGERISTATLGRMTQAKRYHLTTFGCQMNEHDSERTKGMLESLGYGEVARREDADLILFNTCSIREKADNRLVGHLGEAKRLKRSEERRVGKEGRSREWPE